MRPSLGEKSGLGSFLRKVMRFSPILILMGSIYLGSGAVLAVDPVMGQWEGKLRGGDGAERVLEAQIVAEGGDRYRAVMRLARDGAWNAGKSTGRRKGKTVAVFGFSGFGAGIRRCLSTSRPG